MLTIRPPPCSMKIGQTARQALIDGEVREVISKHPRIDRSGCDGVNLYVVLTALFGQRFGERADPGLTGAVGLKSLKGIDRGH